MAVGVAVAWTALRSRPARALILATTAAGIIQGITALLTPSFLAEHRAPFWRDLYPIVFRLDAIEVAVIAGWVLLLAWGWLALANGKRGRQAIALPVACSALIIVGAGHRFLKNARPDIAAWNAAVVASFIENDPRFATFNKRVLMRRHNRALSAFTISTVSVSTRIEAEALDKGRAQADADASDGGVARWTAPAATAAEGYRHVIQSPFMSLYEGHYRAVWRIRTGAEGSYPETLKAVAVAGDDLFNQIEIPLEITRDWALIELPFDLETARRGVVIRLLADGSGTLDVDFLRLEHTELAP